MNTTQLEAAFRRIVSTCSDATGGSLAFDPESGLDTLNQIRSALGLAPVATAEEMIALLDG